MGLQRGVADIDARNKQIEARRNQSYIPELRLYNDGDIAVFRILTDDPVSADYHEIFDKSVSNRPIYQYCKRGSGETCEHCENQVGGIVRLFQFWVYVYKILHLNQNKDGTWTQVTSGNKTMYEEVINTVRLYRSKFGKGSQSWKDFKDFYDENNTWKDRDFTMRRRGVSGDRNTTYKLNGLDRSPMSSEITDIMGKLPSLEAVAQGLVSKLDLGNKEETAEKKTESTEKKTKASLKTKKEGTKEEPKTTVDLDEKLTDDKEGSGDAED